MHLLVALDDSEPGWAAIEHALSEHPEAEITVVHVMDLTESSYGEFAHLGTDAMRDRRREEATELFEAARDRATAHDVSIETELLEGRPADAVVEYATANAVDRIVVGSHGRTGVSRVLLGSVAERVVRRAPVPVTIVR
ncbi:universal stress protein [Natronobacterium texcoconense]|uniref:Nucleotide-binding universal stress protein, UspA family n=1 Tax=Natronobacterium texcoconense TaxID=1095778 RepID=A0A1H1GP24_NATTX|nr:universal stress protein [Natronobacterium texcoconense]SDR14910.1 Nucleotide-binding universal stress protein, UspA family [Natronobacterium texcoconense]